MALTVAEKVVVEGILLVAARNARQTGNLSPYADFAEMTIQQQKDFLRPRVQTIRDGKANELNNINTEMNLRTTTLNNEISVLDGLIVKLT